VEKLLEDWCAVVGRGRAAADDTLAAGRDLLSRWSEPHRHYHTVEHLAAMLSIVDAAAADADDATAVRLAVWFHDAVYDPRRADNEEASALLAEAVLGRLGIPAGEVARLVRLTSTHDPAPGDRNGALLCDADLAILAASPAEYRRYANAVRAEYTHIPDDAFLAGRSAVLRRLLAQPTLFRLTKHRKKWEEPARKNLRIEVSALTGSPFTRKPLDP
jgi:predicted metal-dependent HD superfamily phosphohydrolase